MQTKIIAVLVALVVIAGGAYAYASYSGSQKDAMKDTTVMHDDMMASTSVDVMMH